MVIDYASQVTNGPADLGGVRSHVFELNQASALRQAQLRLSTKLVKLCYAWHDSILPPQPVDSLIRHRCKRQAQSVSAFSYLHFYRFCQISLLKQATWPNTNSRDGIKESSSPQRNGYKKKSLMQTTTANFFFFFFFFLCGLYPFLLLESAPQLSYSSTFGLCVVDSHSLKEGMWLRSAQYQTSIHLGHSHWFINRHMTQARLLRSNYRTFVGVIGRERSLSDRRY